MSQLESLKSNFCESDPNSNIETVVKDVYNKKISELLKNKLAKLQRPNPSSNKNASSSNKIVNLSDYKPSPYELAILEKGLSFCPSKKIDEIQFFSDIESYFRRLKLKEFLCNNTSPNTPTNSAGTFNKNQPQSKLNNSNWSPPSGRHQTLDLYIECFRKQSHAEIMKLDQKSYDNISCKERAAIQSLKRNKNIIIKPADKGGATVILNRSDYIKEGKNQLNHQQNYQTLSLDPTKNFKLELTKLIKSFPDPYKSQLLSYIPPIPTWKILPSNQNPQT